MLQNVFLESRHTSYEISINVFPVAQLIREIEIYSIKGLEAEASGEAVEIIRVAVSGRIRYTIRATARGFLVVKDASPNCP